MRSFDDRKQLAEELTSLYVRGDIILILGPEDIGNFGDELGTHEEKCG